jgi:hypothetical protein
MPFSYQEAVPWGRSFDEYCRMFHLTNADLSRRILGCADGPANFNAQMRRNGHRVISCDPLYQWTSTQIKQRIDATYETVIGQTRHNQDKFVWDQITSPDELGRVRLAAMHDFLSDYDQGKRDGRYVAAQLPELPFVTDSFELAVCSHLLFFYADTLSLSFHHQAIDELCRVAHEVRIFPLLTYNAEPCPFVVSITAHLRQIGHRVSIEPVPYEFQRGGNEMLRVSHTTGG